MSISIDAKKEIRSFIVRNDKDNYSSNAQIKIINGNSSPYVIGRSFRFTTKSGKPVYFPNAYRKASFGNMVYIPSTREIVVGKNWLRQLELDLIQVKLSRKRGKFVSKELPEFLYNVFDKGSLK